MAFTVKRRSQGAALTTWHMPYKCPITQDLIDDVEWLQADGDELDQVRQYFSFGTAPVIHTVPMPRSNIARWYGDIAKTILFSL